MGKHEDVLMVPGVRVKQIQTHVEIFFKKNYLREMNSMLLRAIREKDAKLQIMRKMLFVKFGIYEEDILEFAKQEPYPNPYKQGEN